MYYFYFEFETHKKEEKPKNFTVFAEDTAITIQGTATRPDKKEIVGYTDLKILQENNNNADDIFRFIGIEKNLEFAIQKKKKPLQRISGYISTDQGVVAVVRLSLFPFFSVLLLLVAIIGCFSMCSRDGENTLPVWKPEIENFDESQNTEDSTAAQRGIKMVAFSRMAVSAETGEGNVVFENPATNSCYFTFSLYLDDGTLLYQSKQVPPDKKITNIKIQQTLPVGTYNGYFCILPNDMESGQEMNSGKFMVEIISQ